MNWLHDSALHRLRALLDVPDLTGTRYQLLHLLGRGGMGAVYAVQDTVLGRTVALKVVETGAGTDDTLPQEARVMARLEHPGLVPVHDAGVLPDGRAYYVMRLIQGERLDRWAAEAKPLFSRLTVFLRICEPVAYAHSQGVAHRDLKPQNIMLGPFGQVLVLDWGLTAVAGPAGTPGWMAPEQAGGAAGPAVDVYALGRLLVYLAGEDARTALRIIAAKAAATDPEVRYGSAEELAEEVRRFLAGERVLAHEETVWERATRLFHRHRVTCALVLAYLLMRIIVFLVMRA